jgi:hypothetical protein
MLTYSEKIRRLKDLALPAALGSSIGYLLRSGVNLVMEGNNELSKSVSPNLDEIARPSAVTALYTGLYNLFLEIDRRVIGANPIFQRYLVRHPFLRYLFYTYPSPLHTTIPKATTLLACGLWELSEYLFPMQFKSTKMFDQTPWGTLQDVAMDISTVLSQNPERPKNPKFVRTLRELKDMDYLYDYGAEADKIFGYRENGVAILASRDPIFLRGAKITTVEKLRKNKRKPWHVQVWDGLYGDIAELVHWSSPYEYSLDAKNEIATIQRSAENSNQPPRLFSEVFEYLEKNGLVGI